MLKFLILLFFILTNSAFAELKIGDALPQIKGTTQENVEIETKSFLDKKDKDYQEYILVYFYPKADTPGCTKQACSLRDAYAVLQKKGVKIFGVSTDKVADQKAFKEKFKLPFDLIADTEKVWTKAFDVGVTFGFASRQAFLFKAGKLVWLDTSASTAEQAKDVLDFIK